MSPELEKMLADVVREAYKDGLEAGRIEGRAQLAREQREAQERIQRIREDQGVEM